MGEFILEMIFLLLLKIPGATIYWIWKLGKVPFKIILKEDKKRTYAIGIGFWIAVFLIGAPLKAFLSA